MSLGITNSNDFETEKARLGIIPTPPTAEVIDINRGRGNTKEVPEVIREIIAEEAIINGNTDQIAKRFGISKSSVDAYKHGATSTATYNEPNEKLKKANDELRGLISTSARLKLLEALAEMTPERISKAKIRDIAAITKDLSAVARDMDSIQQPGNNNGIQVTVYAPRLREEAEFEVITVNE
jgi:predicted transcriptional regulator